MAYEDDDEYGRVSNDGDEAGFIPFNPRGRDYESDGSSVSSHRRRQRKNNEEMKKMDKGYHKFKRIINHKPVEIEIYSTNDMPATMIRDAVSGARYNQYRVGTPNEHLFFKVKIATGELGNDSGLVFFDSPEQYERHFKGSSVVSQEDKEKWTNKRAEIMAKNSRLNK